MAGHVVHLTDDPNGLCLYAKERTEKAVQRQRQEQEQEHVKYNAKYHRWFVYDITTMMHEYLADFKEEKHARKWADEILGVNAFVTNRKL